MYMSLRNNSKTLLQSHFVCVEVNSKSFTCAKKKRMWNCCHLLVPPVNYNIASDIYYSRATFTIHKQSRTEGLILPTL